MTARARLLDPGGEAVPNTPIKLVLDRWPAQSASEAEREILPGSTDDDGRFVFGYPGMEPVDGGLDVGEACSLWADIGDGWRLIEVLSSLGWEHPVDDGVGPVDEELELELSPRDFEFRFQVSDERGQPLEGATIQLVAGEHGAPVDHLPARRTGSDGKLHWGDFAYGRWWVDISCPGYAPLRTQPYQSRPSDPSSVYYGVSLRPAREVTVEVVDERGQPAAGALIVYTFANEGLPTWSEWAKLADGAGEAVILIPATGACEVEARFQERLGSMELPDQLGRVRVRLELAEHDEFD